jgi:hypothetical protein
MAPAMNKQCPYQRKRKLLGAGQNMVEVARIGLLHAAERVSSDEVDKGGPFD